MKITDVKAVYVDHGPGPRPFSDAGYRDQKRVFGYDEVFSDEGLTGFCPGAAPPALVEQDLKEMIVGQTPLEIERIWQRLFQGWRHPKMDDLMAISKVDIAVWDLLGKALQQPVWRLLGGARDRVRAYGAGGMYMDNKGVAELVDEMVDFTTHGYSAVKMKVAGAPFNEDIARVAAVREAIGPDAGLMIDANHAWTPYEATRFYARGGALRYRLARGAGLPVGLPRLCRGRPSAGRAGCDRRERELALRLPRHGRRPRLRHRPGRPALLRRDHRVAQDRRVWRRHNLPMAPHGSPHVGAHCVGGVQNGLIVEVGMYAGRQSSRPSMLAPLAVDAGHIQLTDAPGFGFHIDREAIKWNVQSSS